jgi:Kef-type K+ transport system membrane component KefB
VAAEVAERVGVPAVVGEILAGILIGPSLLGWVGADDQVLRTLGEIGVILLLLKLLLGLIMLPFKLGLGLIKLLIGILVGIPLLILLIAVGIPILAVLIPILVVSAIVLAPVALILKAIF